MVTFLTLSAAFGLGWVGTIHPALPVHDEEGATASSPVEEGVAGEVIRGVHRSPHGERAYRLYLPPGVHPRDGKAREPIPLTLVLHGCTQDADDVARGTRMDEHARERGMAVLYPEQPESAHPMRCWNWYEADHQERDRGEPAILAGMIRQLLGEWELGTERVFVAGISAGGAMALNLAATHPELVAGLASHSGVPFAAARGLDEATRVLAGELQEPPGNLGRAVLNAMGDGRRMIPLLVLHGEEDQVVWPGLATWFLGQWMGLIHGVEGRQASWRVDPDRPGSEAASRIETLQGADGRVWFELWVLRDLGHAWSGGSARGTFTDPEGLDASRLILDFFLAHMGGPE